MMNDFLCQCCNLEVWIKLDPKFILKTLLILFSNGLVFVSWFQNCSPISLLVFLSIGTFRCFIYAVVKTRFKIYFVNLIVER